MAEASKDSGYVDNWQSGKSVTECNLHMLTTEECSDVILCVGLEKQVVRAHRYILMSRSCVFHAMFCGPLAEKGEITIPDIETDVFREFLRYLYTDAAAITHDNVTGLLYTSRKYDVDALFNKCVTFLEQSEEIVCDILEQCHGYGEMDLEQRALKILTKAGEKVIKSPGFLDLCSDCLGKFLISDQLNLKEEDVFNATLSWAKKQCKRKHISSTPENLKDVLGDLRYEIRFTSFSLDFLVKTVGPSGILTEMERISIMDKTVDTTKDISPFKSGLRKNWLHLPPKTVKRYKGISRKGRVWSYIGGGENAISFSVSKNIQLVGCQLYGPRDQEESIYNLNILLYDDQDKVISEPVSKTSRKLRGGDGNPVNDVMFPDAVPLDAHRIYTICVGMTGKDTYFGTEERGSQETDGVIFTFRRSSRGNAGGVDQGQIPGLIWN